MKISRIEVFPFSLAMQRGREVPVTYGTLSAANNIAVRVTTDEGIAGWGEASCSLSMFYFNGESQASVRAGMAYIAPQLLGQDASNLNDVHERLGLVPRNQAKGAIDIALHDLIGKQLRTPVHGLLGGSLAKDAPMSYTIGISSPKEMATEAVKRVEEGFRTLEVKVGRFQGAVSVEDDVARVKAVRDAIGNGIILIVDANVGWSIRQAVRVIQGVEGLDVLVEQPARYLEGMREIRKRTSAPIIADESCQSLQDTVRIIQMEAADIISMKLTKFAGFYESMKVLALAEAFGLDYRYDNMTQSRLAATASLHLALAHSKGIPSGGTAFLKYEKDLVSEGGLKMTGGVARLEDHAAPGLGVSLREELLSQPDVYKL